ncbi:MAG: hypothetical protein ACKVP7_01210 [Hyphomicrobiaceae bacterium]
MGQAASYALDSFGPGFPAYFQSYLDRRKTSEGCGGSPEKFYLRSNALAYQEAEDRFEPCLDDVDALVHWPGHGRIRHRYTRLMLPFRVGERSWVLSTTAANPDVNLLG